MPEGFSESDAEWDGAVIDTGRMVRTPVVDSRGVG